MAFASRQNLGPHFNEGARLLWGEVRARGLSIQAVSRLVDCNIGVVSRWLYGDTRPRLHFALRLKAIFGIPLEAWESMAAAPFDLLRALEARALLDPASETPGPRGAAKRRAPVRSTGTDG